MVEQHIQCAVDSSLLQRVSKVREHMGLEVLPTAILASELDPFLLNLLQREGNDDPALDPKVTLEDQERYWLSFNKKWETWFDWE